MANTQSAIAVVSRLQRCCQRSTNSRLGRKPRIGNAERQSRRVALAAQAREFADGSVAAHLERRVDVVVTCDVVADEIAKGAPVRELRAEYVGKVTDPDMLAARLMHNCGLKVVVNITAADANGLPLPRERCLQLTRYLLPTDICEGAS
ncbi:hypothetical protein [Mycolicibacterium pyrenivorans]|uniref:hypothetical protein n=1 Tax=Mycolicibacterium pyrenivorans TaxID=187102 RepID=UPI0021F354C4|nr:hypothetical protein [Mycolicibacterium pyrenivorans]MCV7150142.1 hypothetical protein [Mycolicibacterium pyrenivorans]